MRQSALKRKNISYWQNQNFAKLRRNILQNTAICT